MPDDYVKRSDVHKAFQPKYAPAINRTFAAMIDSVPAADVVEVRHGRWREAMGDSGVVRMACTNCGFYRFPEYDVRERMFNYCPHCGAKMSDKT